MLGTAWDSTRTGYTDRIRNGTLAITDPRTSPSSAPEMNPKTVSRRVPSTRGHSVDQLPVTERIAAIGRGAM